jgi:2-epi-5-epi-valiolone 7-phosphate 2-epimerase
VTVRFGVAAWCLDASGPDALARAARLGLTCVQIDAGAPGDRYHVGSLGVIDALRRASEESGVTLIGMGAKAVNDIGMTEGEGSRAEQRCRGVMRSAIEAAAALGVGFVFFPSFRASEIRDERGIESTARLLGWACREAVPHGIRIGSENSMGAEGNLRLASAVGEPNFRIVLDTYNPVIYGHRVAPLLAALEPYIAEQIHAKDGTEGRMGSAPLGRGDAGFIDTMAELTRRGFDGYVILENNYRTDAESRVSEDLTLLARLFAAGPSDR